MAKRLFLAIESELEVEKLQVAEQQAKETGDYDNLYQQRDKAEDLDNSDTEETTDTNTEETTDTGAEETTDPVSEEISAESYRNIALEDFQDVVDTAKQVGNAISETGSAIASAAGVLIKGGTYLADLGITSIRNIAPKVFVGVASVMVKIAKVIITTSSAIDKYLDRRINSFNSLKSNIADLKESLVRLETDTDLSGNKFTTNQTINALKILDGVDFKANIIRLNDFINATIAVMDSRIKNDYAAIKHLIAYSNNNITKLPDTILTIKPLDTIMVRGNISGYENESDIIESYHSKHVLPGDVVFIANIPKTELTELTEIAQAYSATKMFYGIVTDNFKAVESIDYMSKDQLISFLDSLEKLCNSCIAHQNLYESIKKQKSSLSLGMKNYFLSLASAKDKVSLKHSLIQQIYLKTVFIDKVYIAAAIDTHDYAIKVITRGLSFTRANIKALS